MGPVYSSARWLDRVQRDGRPLYQAIVEAIAAAVGAGELAPGDQLPPQRTVAALLGVDFTTVTRAYGLARKRGLVEGAVGRGTFVRSRSGDDETGLVDLSMNLPPPPDGLSLGRLLRETTAAVLDRSDSATLMAYHPGAGALRQKAAGAAWLAPCLGEIDPNRVLVCPGAQTGLAAVLAALSEPGDALLVEPLAYPGLKSLAAQLGLRLIPCPVDEDGLVPEGVDQACREHRPRALYLIPTMQNPTAVTLSADRRREIAAIAQAQGVWIIEDDPYSRLMETPPAAVATFAPDRTFHLATLSKSMSPGLRLAYLSCPPAAAELVAESLRAVSLMPAPLMTAVVTSWIRDGTAETLLAAVRREARARRQVAAEILPAARGSDEGVHVWLDLADDRDPQALRLAAQERGLSLVTADAFATGAAHRNGVRISLGGPAKRAVLSKALTGIAALVDGAAPSRRLVV